MAPPPQIPFSQAQGTPAQTCWRKSQFRGFSEPDDLGGEMKGRRDFDTFRGEIVNISCGWLDPHMLDRIAPSSALS